MKISKDKLDKLSQQVNDFKTLQDLHTALVNDFRTYKATAEAQIHELSVRRANLEASNQQLSQSHGQINELCKQLALEKDKMSSAMVTMWNRFEECIQRYHKLSGFKG